MGWTELRERGGDMTHIKSLLKETKENLMELCEMVESMDSPTYGERGDYGERDAWRIERERRGRRMY